MVPITYNCGDGELNNPHECSSSYDLLLRKYKVIATLRTFGKYLKL